MDHRASVGFLPPLAPKARRYWARVIADLERGGRVLLVARLAGHIAGAVQLEPASKRNATHRAEVQKLLVHTSARRQGIGGALMRAIEREAIGLGRTLLVLDTVKGDDAERLYPRLGYIRAGEIRTTPSAPTEGLIPRWSSIAWLGESPASRDILREALLRVVLRLVADHLAGVGDAPEGAGVV